jgi:hypothetical protein
VNIFKKFEQYFLVYHKKAENEKFELNRSNRVCKRLIDILVSCFPTIPVPVIQLYVKVRTYVRIKAINNELSKYRFKRLNKNREFQKSFVPSSLPFVPQQPNQSQIPSCSQPPKEDAALSPFNEWNSLDVSAAILECEDGSPDDVHIDEDAVEDSTNP